MSETIKIKVHVSTKYINSGDVRTIDTDVTPAEREEMGEDKWQALCDDLAEQEVWNIISWSWEEA